MAKSLVVAVPLAIRAGLPRSLLLVSHKKGIYRERLRTGWLPFRGTHAELSERECRERLRDQHRLELQILVDNVRKQQQRLDNLDAAFEADHHDGFAATWGPDACVVYAKGSGVKLTCADATTEPEDQQQQQQ